MSVSTFNFGNSTGPSFHQSMRELKSKNWMNVVVVCNLDKWYSNVSVLVKSCFFFCLESFHVFFFLKHILWFKNRLIYNNFHHPLYYKSSFFFFFFIKSFNLSVSKTLYKQFSIAHEYQD